MAKYRLIKERKTSDARQSKNCYFYEKTPFGKHTLSDLRKVKFQVGNEHINDFV